MSRALACSLLACSLLAVNGFNVPARTSSRRVWAHRAAIRANAAPAEAIDAWMVATGRDETPVAISLATDFGLALSDFWAQICTTADSPFRERALVFPLLDLDASDFQRFMAHINSCSEVCETLGDSVFVALRHPQGSSNGEPAPPYPMLLLRTSAGSSDFAVDDDDDPFWSDFPDDDKPQVENTLLVAGSNADVLSATRKWVEAVIVHMKVCPFSASADRAGMPQGGVSYPVTRAKTADEVYAEFWHQVELLSTADERALSTVLLITPDFMLNSAGGFDLFADTLTEALTLLGVESRMQLVFFHPEYTFRDGKDRAGGEGGSANYARRSPFPMINLLRTPQVRAAQKGIPTGSVYDVNEKNMLAVGADKLEAMLQAKDWTPVLRRQDFEVHAPRSE
jgi:hypothetical protein